MSTEFNEFDSIKIGLASPEKIRSWSYGEVKKPETINYRTLKPEREGLFCEKIFGPTKDWECHCGKYKKLRYKGKVCERCGVEITLAKVRRERMGHIELAAPVSHIWYFKGIPSRIGLLLEISPRLLERVLYFSSYIVTDVVDEDIEGLKKGKVLTEKEYQEYKEIYGDDFQAGMGAEAVRKLLEELDLDELSQSLRSDLEKASSSGQKHARLLKRLEVVDAIRNSGNRPEWMILTVLPVIPPDIRPMVQLDGGRFATSDLNDLYRRVINRNNRLKRLIELHAPEIIIRNEKRMLQEAVDALIDNGRRGRAVSGPNSRPLKSLSDMLKGKQGRFRQNLLGKRVDYSGRSVIVVGPELKIYQCGLPKEMALELFKPFVMKKLVDMDISKNIKNAKKMVERANDCVWDALETVIKNHPILLNRAPTLHRLGIQAFEPVLVEGRALKLHPLVCTAYNADFDGDQMAVHVPLSTEAQAEARFLMLSANNLLKPQDGKPVTVPTQDMVLGSYYLTLENKDAEGAGSIFSCINEAMLAYDAHYVHIHAPIKVRMSKVVDGQEVTGLVETTIGKIIFNEDIPQDLGFVDRSKPENILKLEINQICTKKELGKIIDKCIKVHGISEAAKMLDIIKARGYKYSTKGAITMSVSDIEVPQRKYELIAEAEKKIDSITRDFRRGLISEDERYRLVIGIWDETTKAVTAALQGSMDEFNPINMMANSGARGSINQIRQLAGMRGLMANTSGKVIDIPIRANFREGLNVLEYFISSRGARKGLADTALRTADSGYLTRRLVDVAQDVIIRSSDCGTDNGIWVFEFKDGNERIEGLMDRLIGRYTAEAVVDANGEEICGKNVLIDEAMAKKITNAGVERVKIRSLLTCKCHHGVCAKCYGLNLATSTPVRSGEAVGIIAAQSIGEPGTQLTMRTFHTGGVALAADITQGLPRVEELFEARKPKAKAILSEIAGTISIEEVKNNKVITVTNMEESKVYTIPFGARIKVVDGQEIEKGGEFTEGWADPHDILDILGPDAVQNYIMKEVQRAYRLQGVDINDKHIEVIVRQMMRKYKVEDAGSTGLLLNKVVDMSELEIANEAIQKRIDAGEEDLSLATASQTLLGITKASLATDSFLSAASFQETTRVLTEAAICGKEDPLIGLKENVILGKLIPAGTGLPEYRNVEIVEKNVEEPEIIDVEY